MRLHGAGAKGNCGPGVVTVPRLILRSGVNGVRGVEMEVGREARERRVGGGGLRRERVDGELDYSGGEGEEDKESD